MFDYFDLRLNAVPLYEGLGSVPKLFICKCPHSFIRSYIHSTGSDWADTRETEEPGYLGAGADSRVESGTPGSGRGEWEGLR